MNTGYNSNRKINRMHPLLETLKIKNGRIYHLNDHQNRMNLSDKKFCGLSTDSLSPRSHIKTPREARYMWFKWGVVYGLSFGKRQYSASMVQRVQTITV